MSGQIKPHTITTPSIKITLTTFLTDENGELSEPVSCPVKIDGEEDISKEVILDFPIFKSVLTKNLLVLSFGQFLLFFSFTALSNLQSTINSKEGLGSITLAVAYGSSTISSFFLPSAIIKRWGCKKTLMFATICFCPFILANYYPAWSTLIPTAVVCGLAYGPLWSARSTYLNQISYRYAKLQKLSVGILNAWFFSISTTFHQNTEIWGNLLSYYTLKVSARNESYFSVDVLSDCGPDFCDDIFSSSHHFEIPSVDRWYILVTLFITLALIAAFCTAFFLDPLEWKEPGEIGKRKISPSDFLETLCQLTNSDQALLLPLSLYTGLIDGFYSGDYKKAYIACAWGVPHVATVSICYGVISSLVDSACGPCIQVLGRAALFILAATAHLSMFLALILWRPDPERTTGFFLVASAYGIGNGIWMSQLTALYGILFKDNEVAGFSCYYFLHSLGYLLSYSYSSYLCTNAKLYIPLTVLLVGLIAYLAVEIRMAQRTLLEYNLRRRQKAID